MKTPIAALILSALTLSGCAAMPPEASQLAPPTSQYQAHIVDPRTGDALSVAQLASELANTDVVVIGEHHDHHASHLLQARLQQSLFRQTPEQILSMEQFNLDH
ncbi:MAG: ChaN family lipoprotein, partial [Marinobacter sp.]